MIPRKYCKFRRFHRIGNIPAGLLVRFDFPAASVRLWLSLLLLGLLLFFAIAQNLLGVYRFPGG